MKILIILLTLINSLFANPLSSEGLRIVTPEGWNYSAAQEPLIGIVREPQSAYSAFARNVVFTKEPMTASQIEMFQKDPVTKQLVSRDVTKADQLVDNTFLPSEVILRVNKKTGQDITHVIKKKRLAKVCLKFILKVSILLI